MAISSDSNELHTLSESLKRISGALHEHARVLEVAIESTYVNESSNPRVSLLSRSLQVSRRADWELGRLSQKLLALQTPQNGQAPAKPSSPPVPSASPLPAGSLERERDELKTSISTLTRQRDELGTLYEIARTLNSTLDFNQVLQLVMDQVIDVVGAERGFLMLVNEKTNELEFKIARNKSAQTVDQQAFEHQISQSTVNRVVRTGQPLLTSDAQSDASLMEQRSIIEIGIRSIMCAPLAVRDKCIGAVYVDSIFTRNLFSSQNLDLLLAFCHQAAIAIDNARLFADLEKTLRKVNEDKRYMDNIFSSIANGVITTDSAGMITMFNDAAGIILNMNPADAVGKHYQQAFSQRAELGLAALLQNAVLKHVHGTIVPNSLDCEIPRRGRVNLNFYVTSLRDEQGTHIGMALVIDDRTELKKAQADAKEIKRIFGRYVHPKVVEQLISDPKALNLGGETKEISVISADIRGFTKLSERMIPEKVMTLLNTYFDLIVQAVWEEEGTITGFWGDAFLAIFNAPLEQKDHALRAVRAAWRMRRALMGQQSHLSSEIPVSFGIGVNSGLAMIGNIGSRERIQNYTAIGDTVNVANRLQSNAKDNDIYLDHSTFTRVRDQVLVDFVGQLSVKNKTEPLDVFRLRGFK